MTSNTRTFSLAIEEAFGILRTITLRGTDTPDDVANYHAARQRVVAALLAAQTSPAPDVETAKQELLAVIAAVLKHAMRHGPSAAAVIHDDYAEEIDALIATVAAHAEAKVRREIEAAMVVPGQTAWVPRHKGKE